MLNDLGYGDYVQAMLLGKYKDRPGMDKWNKDNDSFEDPVAELAARIILRYITLLKVNILAMFHSSTMYRPWKFQLTNLLWDSEKPWLSGSQIMTVPKRGVGLQWFGMTS